MTTDTAPLRKPVTYDELYPGRFIKAGELLGKKVPLTIADVDLEELSDSTGKAKIKCIVSFKETQKMLVACKTNGLCIKAMFGKTLADWKGKRVFLFQGQWNGEECVRIWGSPDIKEEFEVEIALPRKRPFKMTMHKVAGAKAREPGSDG